MSKKSLISPEGQSVTFVELFFDLVFVFAITQITASIHGHLDFEHILQAVLIFWLIWWSWTQFTWTLNNLDTTNPIIEFVTLMSTAVAFFMAIAIPDAFGDRALLFGVTYIITRSIGLSFQIFVPESIGKDTVVKRWVVTSFAGLALVFIGSYVGGNLQYALWTATILLDLFAASSASSGEWNIQVEHFTERHGLIIIIALGESLIVAAAGLIGDRTLDSDLIWISIFVVSTTCALWWSYFVNIKPVLDKTMEGTHGNERASFGRDVYSLSHFPMLAGIIGFALIIEEAIAHPHGILPFIERLTLAVGLLLFLGGSVLAIWRATRKILFPRLALTILGSIVIASGIIQISSFVIAFVSIVTFLAIERNLPKNLESENVKII